MKNATTARKSGISPWKAILLAVIIIVVPYGLYVNIHPRFVRLVEGAGGDINAHGADAAHSLGQLKDTLGQQKTELTTPMKNPPPAAAAPGAKASTAAVGAVPVGATGPYAAVGSKNNIQIDMLPVQGPVPTEGAKPLFGIQHKGTDAIFALAANYPKLYYQRFVGSLRKAGYNDDIVLATSPVPKMKAGVKEYITEANIVAYGFDVDCQGTDNCRLLDEFLGYPDPRPHRTFANIRYALYEYWLRHYSEQSYILILDFRDTFFQGSPFAGLGTYGSRVPKFDLQMYAENYKVKNIGICVFNSMWVSKCFGKPALEAIKKEAVICSGSTLGSYRSVHNYVRTMLSSMDTVKCWLKGIESDQGYQNYLFYNGHFNTAEGNATLNHQGYGAVNTIGAMNGFRVPADQKGPLDTFWKIRDAEGYVLNYDGTRSACVHQWDRWHDELHKFVDTKLFDRT